MNAQHEVVVGELELVGEQKRQQVAVLQDMTPSQLVAIAAQRGENIEYLRELMQLEREWKADKAKEAFNLALAEFKKTSVVVVKDRENKQYSKGDQKAMYTSLGNLVNTVNAAMAPFGLNASWSIDQASGITVTCLLTHTLGFSKSVTLSGPPDSSGSKNPLQQIKSTITYLQGATFQAVTGIVANDSSANSDDDGNAAYERVSVDQVTELNDLITETGADKPKFIEALGVASLEDLPKAAYYAAKVALKAKRDKKPGAK